MRELPLRLVVSILGLGCLFGLVHVASVSGLHLPFDPDEGWNAAFTQMVLTTGSPYPAAGSFLTNNYPPISFYVVAALTHFTGDAIVAGRCLALASLVAAAAEIHLVLRRMGCSVRASAFSAFLFIAAVGLTSDYAGMDDPQMLGHAVSLAALLAIVREPQASRNVVIAAALFVLAFFIKHDLVILPVATAAWLALANRPLSYTFVASGIVFLLLGLGLFKQGFGFDLLSVIVSPRSYALDLMWNGLKAWLPWGGPLLLGAAALATIARHDRYALFGLIYVVLATAAGAYFFGGAGVDTNAMFDANIALALCGGLLLDHLANRPAQALVVSLYGLTVLYALFAIEPDWRSIDFWTDPLREEQQAAAREIQLIRSTPGPALCETMALCYWAGKSAFVDVFNLSQAYLTGRRSDDSLAKAISGAHFGIVQFEQLSPFPLTPRIRSALLARYRLVHSDADGVFFVPR
jgi:hypothetical protein